MKTHAKNAKGQGTEETTPLLRTRAPYSSLDIVFATSLLSESLGQTNTVIPQSNLFNNTHLYATASVYLDLLQIHSTTLQALQNKLTLL